VQLDGASIVDVAPTVLYGMGLPVPEDMDGRPLLEIFTSDYRAANPVRTAPPVASDGVESRPVYDAEEVEEMERRLRGLGYVS
jgi:arylsulfatase A-like enzyme